MKTVCLNMIVKNEAAILHKALASMVHEIDYYVICDTGSSDHSIELIKSFFQSYHLPGEVHTIDFVNFESARNQALQKARESKGTFEYLLFCDADMELRVQDTNWKAQLKADCYTLRQENDWLNFYNPRLIHRSAAARYVGVTHECLQCNSPQHRLDAIYFYDHANGANRSDKFERDLRLLKQGLEDQPGDHRYLFYLGQTYFDLKQYAEAIPCYQARIAQGGWEEEVFYAYYRIALCRKNLNEPEVNISKAFLDCYDYRPTRAESLHELAVYYRQMNQYPLAYMYAKAAAEIPYPQNDVLFIEKDVYAYKILDEISISAYFIGEYQESLRLCDQLLNCGTISTSERERIQKNREFPIAKLRWLSEQLSYR